MSTTETAAVPLQLTDALVAEVRDAVAAGNPDLVAALSGTLHAADLADLLQRLDRDDRFAVIAALGPSFDAETLAYLDDFVRDQVIEALGPEATGEVLAQLETDDAVEILADFDEAEQAEILASLPLPEREAMQQALAFPEWSAGRLMQRDVVAVPDYWNVGQTVDYLRAHPDLPEDFYDLFLIDPRFRVVGDVPLSRVLRSKRATPLVDLKYKELRSFPAETDQEEVARAFRRYALVSAPVVDGDGRLLGVITVDDVVDVIGEEAEDDILKLGGVSEDDTYVPVLQTSFKRLPWLGVNLFTALLGALRHHPVRGHHRPPGLARRPDAAGGRDGRQRRHPGAHRHRPLARRRRDHPRQHLARDPQGARRRPAQRRHLPDRRRRTGLLGSASRCWPPCSAPHSCSTSWSRRRSAPPSRCCWTASARTRRWPPASS